MGRPSHRILLAVILLAALSARLTWVLTRDVSPERIESLPDQREYLDVARSVRAGFGFGFTDPRFNQRVLAYRTPGYPLFVALCGANLRAVLVAQALLDTSSVLAAFLLARRWLPPHACLFAALLVALNPFLVYFCGLLLTETLFTAMLAWGMVLLTSARALPWLAGGAVLALSVLVRPGAAPLPVILGVLAQLAMNRRAEAAYHHHPPPGQRGRSLGWRRWSLPVGTTMLILTLLALLPWAIRNQRVLGRWVWTSTNAGITRYDGFNPNADGSSNQDFVKAMPHLRGMTETERNDYLTSAANEFIRARPRDAVRLAGSKIARTWSPRPLSSEFSRPLYVIAAVTYALPFFMLVAWGLSSPSLTPSAKLFLLAPAVYLTAAVALSVGSLRYRIPAEVPMAVVAAGAFGRRNE